MAASPALSQQTEAQAPRLEHFETETGRDLETLCATGGQTQQDARAFCYGYISGAGDLYAAIRRTNAIPELVCPGAQVPNLDLIRTNFLEWAARNPDKAASASAVDALVQSAAERWPCQSRGN